MSTAIPVPAFKSIELKKLLTLLRSEDPVSVLESHPNIFDIVHNKLGEEKLLFKSKNQLGSALKQFKNKINMMFEADCITVPQGYIVDCPKIGQRKFSGTTGIGPCVACVIISANSNRIALGHCDGSQKENTDSKETAATAMATGAVVTATIKTKEENFADEIIRKMGQNSKVILRYNLAGTILATALSNAFTKINPNGGIDSQVSKMDGGFIILKNGVFVSLGESALLFAVRTDRTIVHVLNLPDDANLNFIDHDGHLHLQDRRAEYETFTSEDWRKDQRITAETMKPKNMVVLKKEADLKSAASTTAASATSSVTAAAGSSKNEKTRSDKPAGQTAAYMPAVSPALSKSSASNATMTKTPPASPIVSSRELNVATPAYDRVSSVQGMFSPLVQPHLNKTSATSSPPIANELTAAAGGINLSIIKNIQVSPNPNSPSATTSTTTPQSLADSFSAATEALTAASQTFTNSNSQTLILDKQQELLPSVVHSSFVDDKKSEKEIEKPNSPSAPSPATASAESPSTKLKK